MFPMDRTEETKTKNNIRTFLKTLATDNPGNMLGVISLMLYARLIDEDEEEIQELWDVYTGMTDLAQDWLRLEDCIGLNSPLKDYQITILEKLIFKTEWQAGQYSDHLARVKMLEAVLEMSVQKPKD